MNNREKISGNNQDSLSGESVDFSEADKARLVEKIETARARAESKRQALGAAIQGGQSEDVIEVLTLELQQKEMVLKDLEENLAIDSNFE